MAKKSSATGEDSSVTNRKARRNSSKQQEDHRRRGGSKHGRSSRDTTGGLSKEARRQQEIQSLQERIAAESPARGSTPPLTQVVAFRALPLSEATLRGLDGASYTTMTAIQNACIPHALAGRDVLGAARTGSGKTLAYLIPVLELLYRHSVTPMDGPAAIVLSPTRELAVQIFSVLKKVGQHHAFSVGLLIGGKKDFYQEQQQIGATNLMIATPGRLLQHCEQTPYMDMSLLKILVLDEADRILDMGFRDQLVRLLDYLPNNDSSSETPRQTLLFSATQTRDVSHLATLSLRQPEYLGVHDKEKNSTPPGLEQSYVVVPLKDKLNAVFSFLKSNLKTKSILFFASCAQVRHAYQLFCSLRPGIPVLALHGRLAQTKRTQVYFDFLQRPHAVLMATDICARGLDFPNVDWVLQVDAPEDRDMYIHRAGRTARYRAGGKALLVLTPSEEKRGFLKLLNQQQSGNSKSNNSKDEKEKKDAKSSTSSSTSIPLKKLSINPSKTVVVGQRAASLVASDVDLNRLAKKAFQSYVRSIHFMPHRQVFGQAQDLDLDGYAASLGLAATPNLQFLKKVATTADSEEQGANREENRKAKNVNRKLQKLKEQIKADKLAKKIAKLGTNKKSKTKNGDEKEENEDDEDLLVSKKNSTVLDENDNDDELIDPGLDGTAKSRHPKKIRIEGSTSAQNKRVVYNDEGEEQDINTLMVSSTNQVRQDQQELARATDEYMEKVRQRLQSTSELDREEAKQRIREKHRKRRLQDKGEKDEDGDVMGAPAAVLNVGDSDYEQDYEHGDSTAGTSSSDSSSDDESQVDDSKVQEEMALALIRGS